MNLAVFAGRLASEPELKTVGETQVTKFTLALRRNFKDKDGNYGADFARITAWGAKAKFISDYFHKGDPINLTASFRSGSYDDDNGNKVYTNEFQVVEVEFPQTKNSENSGQSNSSSAKSNNKASDFHPIEETEEDELPF
jgi:single-strand DNA-binding protein